MSSEDGPGLRTTAFLKGCPLSCSWCHNPESISPKNQVLWHSARCMGCGECVRVCPQKNLKLEPDGMRIARENCTGCYSCCDACPTGAMEAKGRDIPTAKLCQELLKDRAYFGAEGGVTLSGGECLMQEGAIELLRLLKAEGVSTAVDTCGLLPDGRLEAALPYCDILLYDVKLADGALHKKFTGVSNKRILENLKAAGEWAARGGILWIRTPIIPDATDSLENIAAIGEILQKIPGIARWELCAFNNLCANKYKSLGRAWAFEGVQLAEKSQMALLLEKAQKSAACPDIRATGATRREIEKT